MILTEARFHDKWYRPTRNIIAGDKAPGFAYSSNLTDEQVNYFIESAINYFNSEVKDEFIATTKIIV